MFDLLLEASCLVNVLLIAYCLATSGYCAYKAIKFQDLTYSAGSVIYLFLFIVLYKLYPGF